MKKVMLAVMVLSAVVNGAYANGTNNLVGGTDNVATANSAAVFGYKNTVNSNNALALFCCFFESIMASCNPFEISARECGFQEGVTLWIKILHFLGDMNCFNLHMLCNERYNLLKTWYTEL